MSSNQNLNDLNEGVDKKVLETSEKDSVERKNVLLFQRAYYAMVRDLHSITPQSVLPNGEEAGQFAADHVFMFHQKKKELANNHKKKPSDKHNTNKIK